MGDYGQSAQLGGSARRIADEEIVGGPAPAYTNQDRDPARSPVRNGPGLSDIEGTIEQLRGSVNGIEHEIDQLQGRLHLPPIYDVPVNSKAEAAQTMPSEANRLFFLNENLNALGRRLDAIARHVGTFGAKLG